jgi:hypothetical protein
VVAVWATELGFADPSAMDIDSTVQEANIAYPSDAHLMVKMTLLVHKVCTKRPTGGLFNLHPLLRGYPKT